MKIIKSQFYIFLSVFCLQAHSTFAIENTKTSSNKTTSHQKQQTKHLSLAKSGNEHAMLRVVLEFKLDNKYNISSKQYIHFLKKLSKKNNYIALRFLAEEYEQGKHINRDYKKAYELWRIIVATPNSQKILKAHAYDRLASYYHFDHGKGIVKKDAKKYAQLLSKSAHLGNITAASDLASSYYYGLLGVQQDYVQSLKLWKSILEMPSVGTYFYGDSSYHIGKQYRHGEGVDSNLEVAVKYFKKAISFGNKDAIVELATMYLRGDGVQQNTKKALAMLNKAKNQGSTNAYDTLAKIYANGWGVEKDIRKAEGIYNEGLSRD